MILKGVGEEEGNLVISKNVEVKTLHQPFSSVAHTWYLKIENIPFPSNSVGFYGSWLPH